MYLRPHFIKLKYSFQFYTTVPYSQKEDSNITSSKDTKNIIAKPIEENLTPDFKKKLQEWRIKVTESQFLFKTFLHQILLQAAVTVKQFRANIVTHQGVGQQED